MAVVQNIVEGQTVPIKSQLYDDGAPLNLGAIIPTVEVRDRDGNLADTTGDVTVDDATTGKVRFTPDPTDLSASKAPYKARWRVDAGAGGIGYYPDAEPELWNVRK